MSQHYRESIIGQTVGRRNSDGGRGRKSRLIKTLLDLKCEKPNFGVLS